MTRDNWTNKIYQITSLLSSRVKSLCRGALQSAEKGLQPRLDDIDAVYTWVDSADTQFAKDFDKYYDLENPPGDPLNYHQHRYRDSEELRYSLRSLEINAPWINRIFLVTNGQVPSWLNVKHPRLSLVKHSEIFPDQSHLPTFNSLAIETHLHRIKGLSKRFLYFNDDMFLGKKTIRADFISTDGKPKIRVEAWILPEFSEESDLTFKWLAFNHVLLKNYFGDFKFVMLSHAPCLFDRHSIIEVQEIWKTEFLNGSAMRFRTPNSAALYVLYPHYEAFAKRVELVEEVSENCTFVMIKEPLELAVQELEKIKRDRPQFFTINDNWHKDPKDKYIVVQKFLNDYFPNPSSFEK